MIVARSLYSDIGHSPSDSLWIRPYYYRVAQVKIPGQHCRTLCQRLKSLARPETFKNCAQTQNVAVRYHGDRYVTKLSTWWGREWQFMCVPPLLFLSLNRTIGRLILILLRSWILMNNIGNREGKRWANGIGLATSRSFLARLQHLVVLKLNGVVSLQRRVHNSFGLRIHVRVSLVH